MQRAINFIKDSGVLPILIILAGVGLLLFVSSGSKDDSSSEETTEVSSKDSNQADNNQDSADAASDTDDMATDGSLELTQGELVDGRAVVDVTQGDNQTLIVRQVIQDFTKSNNIDLSPAQIIYAETNIVNKMGRDNLIYPNEVVRVNLSLVEQYANRAQELTQAELAAWNTYVPYTNL